MIFDKIKPEDYQYEYVVSLLKTRYLKDEQGLLVSSKLKKETIDRLKEDGLFVYNGFIEVSELEKKHICYWVTYYKSRDIIIDSSFSSKIIRV